MGKYFWAAFKNRWNLLALLAGAGVAVLSGHADVVLPLVAAGEVAYLGLLAPHNRFREFVDAQDAATARREQNKTGQETLGRILRELPREHMDRFDRLKVRCHELRQIAQNLQRSDDAGVKSSFESMQTAGLDRLLWIFLRLLYTQYSMSLFLSKTSSTAIQHEIERAEHRLRQLSPDDPSSHTTKMRRALEDNLQTCRQRLANYDKAQANHDFVELEIDRLENKIKSLAELAINRREHDFISNQVDEVTTSMVETEKTIGELDFATGLGQVEEDVPQLLRQPARVYQ